MGSVFAWEDGSCLGGKTEEQEKKIQAFIPDSV